MRIAGSRLVMDEGFEKEGGREGGLRGGVADYC